MKESSKASNASTALTELVFENELTEQGLADLRVKYPADLVVDMTNEDNFKAGRKVRTERNKLVEAIDRRRIDVTKELKDFGDNLSEEVTEIYSVSVDPFEKEDKRRKEVAAAAKLKLDKLLAEQRTQIAAIRQFLTDAISASSEQISGMVDGVGNIDAKDFHKELVHEAMEVIDEVKSTLADMLLKQIDAERLQEEAIAAEAKAKAAEEELALVKKKADDAAEELRIKTEEEAARVKKETDDKAEEIRLETEARENSAKQEKAITERIANLRMIPMEVMGKNSMVIKKKIKSIKKVEIDADSFLTHIEEATTARDTVLEQLAGMLQQAEQIEALTPANEVAPVIQLEPKTQPTQEANLETMLEQKQVVTGADMGVNSDTTVTASVESTPATLRDDVTVWANKFLAGPNGEYAFEQLMNVLTNHNQ